jgi:hypothetical protein
MAFTPFNERMCTLTIKTKFFNVAIINVHDPPHHTHTHTHTHTQDSENIEKEEFYRLLERTYDSAPSNDIKIIIGDLNAKIGREDIFRDIFSIIHIPCSCFTSVSFHLSPTTALYLHNFQHVSA